VPGGLFRCSLVAFTAARSPRSSGEETAGHRRLRRTRACRGRSLVRVFHVVGARPNFMKVAPVLSVLDSHGDQPRTIRQAHRGRCAGFGTPAAIDRRWSVSCGRGRRPAASGPSLLVHAALAGESAVDSTSDESGVHLRSGCRLSGLEDLETHRCGDSRDTYAAPPPDPVWAQVTVAPFTEGNRSLKGSPPWRLVLPTTSFPGPGPTREVCGPWEVR